MRLPTLRRLWADHCDDVARKNVWNAPPRNIRRPAGRNYRSAQQNHSPRPPHALIRPPPRPLHTEVIMPAGIGLLRPPFDAAPLLRCLSGAPGPAPPPAPAVGPAPRTLAPVHHIAGSGAQPGRRAAAESPSHRPLNCSPHLPPFCPQANTSKHHVWQGCVQRGASSLLAPRRCLAGRAPAPRSSQPPPHPSAGAKGLSGKVRRGPQAAGWRAAV